MKKIYFTSKFVLSSLPQDDLDWKAERIPKFTAWRKIFESYFWITADNTAE
jgi:hypothetical protein